MSRDWIIPLHFAVINQHTGQSCGESLSRRTNWKKGLGRNRILRFHILDPEAVRQRNRVVPNNGQGDPWDV
jgi:hypothetical protein